MELSKEQIQGFTRRLLRSRMRLLITNGFYGLLLMHIKFSIDETIPTAATDGEKIMFNPHFLTLINDNELDFILMHEILHVALEHCFRFAEIKDLDPDMINIACDIVVNSNILMSNDMDIKTIKVHGQESMHLAPNGQEGYKYSVEEVYKMLQKRNKSKNNKNKHWENIDDHTKWKKDEGGSGSLKEIWDARLANTIANLAAKVKNGMKGIGNIPLGAEILLKELMRPQIDWRTILNEFIQEEITDYSFTPPDRRFGDSPFFLPDYNEKEDTIDDILFMIDTSGSMSESEITAAYSEVKGAIDQFNGKLRGWLGFFDADIIEPKLFESVEELQLIKPKGGGGTNFDCVFNYVKTQMLDKPPVSIIMLTDGGAPFPSESITNGIPVLWLLNNEDCNPPWGKVARIKVD